MPDMRGQKFRIVGGPYGYDMKVYGPDGQELKSVKSAEFRVDGIGPAELTLTLLDWEVDVEIDGEHVTIERESLEVPE